MIRPRLVPVNISMQVTGPAAPVQTSIGGWIRSLPVGTAVIVSRLIQVAHESDAGVIRVGNVLINGVAADLTVGAYERPILGTVTVTP